MPPYRGQRVERFTYQLINGVTEENLGFVQPRKDQPPSLSHDTSSGGIKRRLNFALGVSDTTDINPITDRILPSMIIGAVTYPLGRYMFSNELDVISTGGSRGTFTLLDEGFIIDQVIDRAYSPTSSVRSAITGLVNQVTLPGVDIEASPYLAKGSLNPGQTRGQALDAYATQGDYFSYWMDNHGLFRMIRTIDPATAPAQFDWDENKMVIRDSIQKTSDVLNAPNRFVVVSNSGAAVNGPIVGAYDVPASAPFSIQQRGFTITKIVDAEVTTSDQAAAAARAEGIKQTVYDRITLETPLDPRHDSYDVIRFLGDSWLELSWSMQLTPGGTMSHTMRKAYT
jgi:hypothetical protein